MEWQTWLAQYGYFALWIGTFFEGETILVLGGLAAHQGYLKLPGVILAAFCGSLLGDQLIFFLGRRHSDFILNKKPSWRKKIVRVQAIISRWETLVILSFRFLYGLRTITPFVLGMSRVRPIKFVFLNIISAMVWAVAIGTAGYLFGYTLEAILGEIKYFEKWILAAVVIIGILMWCNYFRCQRRRR